VPTVRGALTLTGQRISAAERLYLLSGVPVLLVVGGRDTTIPAHHTRAALEQVPDSRLEVFGRAASSAGLGAAVERNDSVVTT